MAELPIRYYGDPVLREKAQPITQVTDNLRQLAQDMGDTMHAANGIGLAANQVGDLRRIIVVDVTDAGERARGTKRPPRTNQNVEVYLNPEILAASDEDAEYNEGCLSIPGIEGDVWRPVRLRLRWMDMDGSANEADFDGLRARVLQHEIDHLDGVLFIDRMSELARRSIAGRLNKLRQDQQGGQPDPDSR